MAQYETELLVQPESGLFVEYFIQQYCSIKVIKALSPVSLTVTCAVIQEFDCCTDPKETEHYVEKKIINKYETFSITY